MPPTTRPSVPPSLDFKEVSRHLESFQQVDSTRQQLVERLFQRLRELDADLQAANSDLEDQTAIRRHWKKRAEDAEALLAQSQFVLALVDGNRYTFADQYLKNTETGGADAARDLVGQIRGYVKERSPHEDSTKVCLMVQIFANKTALSQALIDSGTISGPGHFDDFIAQFMGSQPFMHFVDCGSFEGAVDSKIQESYEFHFDNALCKHLLLALRHDSGYIMELDTYREDESTLARTSLMRSSNAVIGRFASTFHVAPTPALTTIPLISLENANGTIAEKNEESRSSVTRTRFPARNHDLHGLFEVGDQDSPATEQTDQSEANQSSGINSTAQKRDSSTTSSTAAVPRNGERDPSPPVTVMQEAKEPLNVPPPNNLTPVQHPNTAPFLGPVNSYMNEWESAPSADIYTPPPDHRPWGSEDGPSWEDASNNEYNGKSIAKTSDRSTSRETSSKSPDAFERASVGKPSYHNSGKGAAGGPMVRRAKQTPRQSLPPVRSPRDVPEFIPQSGPGISSSMLEPKYPSPSSQPATPSSASSANVAVNRHGQRIDLPLARPSAEDVARYDSRWHTKKLCNDHHLRGECASQDCKFDHEPIDEGIRLALKNSARKIPCKIGPGCRRRDCPNGHHCPYRLNPAGCTNKQCAFNARGMHKVDDLSMDRFVPTQ